MNDESLSVTLKDGHQYIFNALIDEISQP